MPTIFEQIISDVRKRQYASANDLIKNALNEKYDEALNKEKGSLNDSELDEETGKCDDCGKESDKLMTHTDSKTGDSVKLCPDCDKRDENKVDESFASVQKKIEGEGYSKKSAGAILAKKTREASPAAKKANPKLKRVKG